MNHETPNMPKITADLTASEVPPKLAHQLPGGRPIPGVRYRVTLEDQPDDEAKLAALRADLQLGRDQLRAGLGIDGETVIARLRAKYPVKND